MSTTTNTNKKQNGSSSTSTKISGHYDSSTTNGTTKTKIKMHYFEYEFGGPIGTFATITLLPIVVVCLLYWCDIGHVDVSFVQRLLYIPVEVIQSIISNPTSVTELWNQFHHNTDLCPNCSKDPTILWKCTAGLLGWFGFQVALERFLPCDLVDGTFIQNNPSNGKLQYRINGHLAFWVTLFLVAFGYPTYHSASHTWQLSNFPIETLYDYTTELALCTIILCFALSIFLYLDSFRSNKILAVGGNSSNVVYDFFMGRELNPRIGIFDWKEFCELRPGLIGWVLLNLSCMKVQYNELGYITYSMYLINFFQGMYVWDALYNEKAILTTMDITTDGFGFMLVFGDLCWVPFTYSLQARYFVKYDPHLSVPQILGIIVLYIIGYSIFRLSNSEKDAFRTNPNDPSVQHLQYIQTKRGTKLLTSGWWGMARKINYTGDYIVGLSWCCVTGVSSIVPYYYAIYFAILLIHRSIRDDHMCQTKYGSDWDTYKQIVPYRFIPGII